MNMNMNDAAKWIETIAKIISIIAQTMKETENGKNTDSKAE